MAFVVLNMAESYLAVECIGYTQAAFMLFVLMFSGSSVRKYKVVMSVLYLHSSCCFFTLSSVSTGVVSHHDHGLV